MKLNQKPCINTRKVINKEKRSKALSEVKPVQGCAMQRMGGEIFLEFVSIFDKMCRKISRPNVVDKFGVYIF